MSRIRLHFRQSKNSDVMFDDMYYELSGDWKRKADALQVRRWRALKREMKGGV